MLIFRLIRSLIALVILWRFSSSSVQSDTDVVDIRWYGPSGLLATIEEPKSIIPFSGYIDLKVIAENAAGCLDSLTKQSELKVMDPAGPKVDLMERVSVLPNNQIEVDWSKDTSVYFRRYQVFSPLGKQVFADVNDTSTTLNLDGSVSSICVYLGMDDVCSDADTVNFKKHCSVLANGDADTMMNCISWNSYEGWAVNTYYIFKKINGVFVLYDSVSGSNLNYCDLDLSQCRDPQEYRVMAKGDDFFSFSDTARVRPIWNNTQSAPEILNVSVDGDQVIMTLDSGDGLIPFASYEAERLSMNLIAGGFDISDPVNHNDKNLNTSGEYYTYKIRQEDKCEELSNWSDPSRTLWLRVSSDPVTSFPQLTWNHSEVWMDGISYYQVERKIDDGGFVVIATLLSLNDTTYVDKLKDLECADLAEYRVSAVSSDGDFISYSNVVSTSTGSTLFVPNAFSLNYDGLNDGFQPKGLYIQDYSLKIYNRWGELLFETTTCMEGWDGLVDGEPIAQGVCFYVIEALGVDGVIHIRHGTINVLR